MSAAMDCGLVNLLTSVMPYYEIISSRPQTPSELTHTLNSLAGESNLEDLMHLLREWGST